MRFDGRAIATSSRTVSHAGLDHNRLRGRGELVEGEIAPGAHVKGLDLLYQKTYSAEISLWALLS